MKQNIDMKKESVNKLDILKSFAWQKYGQKIKDKLRGKTFVS